MEILVQAFPVFAHAMSNYGILCHSPCHIFAGRAESFSCRTRIFVSVIAYLLFGLGKTVPADGMFIIFIIREVLIGLLIGFLAQLFFTAVQTAGSFIDIQIGFGIANVIDPLTGATSPVMGTSSTSLSCCCFSG